MLVHGVKGGLGPKLQGSHGTGQHPQHCQHCQHHPQDADDAGEWGDHTIGGGGTWPRDWYIYMNVCIYIYIYIMQTNIYIYICIYVYVNVYSLEGLLTYSTTHVSVSKRATDRRI